MGDPAKTGWGSTTADGRPSVDAHAHIFLRNLPLVEGANHVPTEDHPMDEYLALLDANGVEGGVIAGASFLGTYNDYSLMAVRASRRLRATVILDPTTDPYIMRRMDEDGVVGLRLQLRGYVRPNLQSAAYRRLFRRATDLGWHVHLYADRTDLPELVPQLLDLGVTLVLDHFGSPSKDTQDSAPVLAVLRALQTGRAWVKLSAPYRSPTADHAAFVQRFLREAGPERLLWASDWPWMGYQGKFTYRETIDWLSDWMPDATMREAMNREARRFYRFD